MKKNILIWGYYGKNNFGDELMLKSILDLLKDFESNIYVTIDKYKLKNDKIFQEYQIESFDIFYFKSKFKYINFLLNIVYTIIRLFKVDVLIFGGGTQYFELPKNTDILGFFLKYVFTSFLKISGGKLIHLNIGIGEIKNKINLYLFSKIINNSDLFIVRDIKSRNIAESISKKNIILDTDLSYYNINEYDHTSGVDNDKIIGVNVIDYYNYVDIDNEKRKKLKKTICDLVLDLKSKNYSVKFFACQYKFGGKDFEFISEINNEYNLNCEVISNKNLENFIINFKKCIFHIGMRFHYCLFSIQNKIPCIAISYQPKVKSQFHDFGLINNIIEMSDLNSQNLIRKFEHLINSEDNHDYILNEILTKSKFSKKKLTSLLSIYIK